MQKPSLLRIVGVIDLLGGGVVRAVAGRRQEYRPLVSRLCDSAEPLAVAGAYLALGVAELYVADLDAVGGAEPAWGTLRALAALPVRLWVDAGVSGLGRAQGLANLGVDSVVVGLETFPRVGELGPFVEALGERLVFSLDLRGGRPLAGNDEPLAIVQKAVAAGVRRILVLDLARVGVGDGTGTRELCDRLVQAYPQVEFSAGGGVRGREDLQQMRAAGLSAVLVASALHDGRIGKADLLSH